ncbi:MAG: RDD family protein [Gammaproteobacteria bacterium]|nr:RDD family protein [Gammaproteobacteria bacterium]
MNCSSPVKLPRLLATIAYDLIIIIAILLFATTLLFFGYFIFNIAPPAANNVYFRIYLFVILFGYYHISWRYLPKGQTIGMKAWRVQLINSHQPGTPMTLTQSTLRIIGGIIGITFFGLGYISIIFSKNSTSLADNFSQTRLFYV